MVVRRAPDPFARGANAAFIGPPADPSSQSAPRTKPRLGSPRANCWHWIKPPEWDCQPSSGSSNKPVAVDSGWSINLRPTRPDELARPSGWPPVADGEEQAGRTDGIGGAEHNISGVQMVPTLTIDPFRPGDKTGAVGDQAANPGTGHDPPAASEHAGPMGEIG